MPANLRTEMPRFHGSQFFDCLFHVKYLGTLVYINVFANRPKRPYRLQRLKNSVRVVLELLPADCRKTFVSETCQFGLSIHQNDHQARRRFVEWAQNEIAVVPDFHKRILFSDEAHFWLNGYVNKQNCRIWSEANPQVYVETPLHPEKLTVWCTLWAGVILQKR
ncbi:hypothetical protein TNCV_3271141 [Trichonephila clavipes]|nr:hypothetical protein TNCV_3271141 [Trichonephila clavipes]